MKQILTTNNYELFKSIDGNRNVNELHLSRLKKSIQKKYLFTFILVNEKHHIIDGQHRFEVIKELGLPLNYVVCKGYGINEVHQLNENSKNWNADDYLDGYCKLNKLQRVVNAIARWIDTGHPCISSGRTTGKINGGHFWPVSTNRHIRFHLMNIFLQSEIDNNYKSGNISEYREGLKNTFGEAVLAEIEDLKNKYQGLKLQSFEVDEKIVIARSLIKQMKAIIAEKKKLTNEERLGYRHLFNKKIGIYK